MGEYPRTSNEGGSGDTRLHGHAQDTVGDPYAEAIMQANARIPNMRTDARQGPTNSHAAADVTGASLPAVVQEVLDDSAGTKHRGESEDGGYEDERDKVYQGWLACVAKIQKEIPDIQEDELRQFSQFFAGDNEKDALQVAFKQMATPAEDRVVTDSNDSYEEQCVAYVHECVAVFIAQILDARRQKERADALRKEEQKKYDALRAAGRVYLDQRFGEGFADRVVQIAQDDDGVKERLSDAGSTIDDAFVSFGLNATDWKQGVVGKRIQGWKGTPQQQAAAKIVWALVGRVRAEEKREKRGNANEAKSTYLPDFIRLQQQLGLNPEQLAVLRRIERRPGYFENPGEREWYEGMVNRVAHYREKVKGPELSKNTLLFESEEQVGVDTFIVATHRSPEGKHETITTVKKKGGRGEMILIHPLDGDTDYVKKRGEVGVGKAFRDYEEALSFMYTSLA